MSDKIITKKGTELPLLNLRGKKYLEVKYRLVWFREENPYAKIHTEIVQTDKEHSIVRAIIHREDDKVWAMAVKQEDSKGFSDHLEKAETGAIGRALALCGYGTQFTPEIEEGDRIVDAPAARPESAPRAAESLKTMLREASSMEELIKTWEGAQRFLLSPDGAAHRSSLTAAKDERKKELDFMSRKD